MSKFKLSNKSKEKLVGVDSKLVSVVERALELSEVDFSVSEGVRSLERQKELVKAGKSLTMHSKHLTGRAVDVVAYVDGELSWEEKHYHKIASAFIQAAAELSVPIRWGGTFKNKDGKPFFDGPHFELVP